MEKELCDHFFMDGSRCDNETKETFPYCEEHITNLKEISKIKDNRIELPDFEK